MKYKKDVIFLLNQTGKLAKRAKPPLHFHEIFPTKNISDLSREIEVVNSQIEQSGLYLIFASTCGIS